eukprot:Tbor_TRINITY_DN6176_c1_g3::TRINITY_DN6176_c1_g3_i2::g.22382::m.22382
MVSKQREAFDMRIEAKNLSAYDTPCLNYLTSGDSKDIFRLIYLILNKSTCEERIKFHNVLTFGKIEAFSRTGKEAVVLQEINTPLFPEEKHHNLNMMIFDKKYKTTTRSNESLEVTGGELRLDIMPDGKVNADIIENVVNQGFTNNCIDQEDLRRQIARMTEQINVLQLQIQRQPLNGMYTPDSH